MPGEGFEPPTFGLQNRCTTAVLTRPRLPRHLAQSPVLGKSRPCLCPRSTQRNKAVDNDCSLGDRRIVKEDERPEGLWSEYTIRSILVFYHVSTIPCHGYRAPGLPKPIFRRAPKRVAQCVDIVTMTPAVNILFATLWGISPRYEGSQRRCLAAIGPVGLTGK